MCENWGYKRLWKKLREESIGEMRHADRLIERILYMEGVPNVQRLGKVNVGQTVPERLKLDLELRAEGDRHAERGHRALPEPRRRREPRALLEGILVSEEEHVDWLEAQLELIKQLGEAHYLAQQIRE
jgi:bacterioferritin